jgi:hypothetical protein
MRVKLESGPRLDCCVVSLLLLSSLQREFAVGKRRTPWAAPTNSVVTVTSPLISIVFCEVWRRGPLVSRSCSPCRDRSRHLSHRRVLVALPIQTHFSFLHNRSVCSSLPSRYCCTPLSTARDPLKTRWLPLDRNALQTPISLQTRQSVFRSSLIRLISHDCMLQTGHHLHPLQQNVQRLQR